jgi:formate-dependent nitrite reductase cytochrome c552 subunit
MDDLRTYLHLMQFATWKNEAVDTHLRQVHGHIRDGAPIRRDWASAHAIAHGHSPRARFSWRRLRFQEPPSA